MRTEPLREVDAWLEHFRRFWTPHLDAGEAHVATIARTYGTDLDDLREACTSADRITRRLLPVTATGF